MATTEGKAGEAAAFEEPVFPCDAIRGVTQVVRNAETREGAGMIVKRSIGGPKLRNLDPFLMLDHAKTSPTDAGFPDHPHRGFETVSYVLKGAIKHEDFCGHEGVIREGGVQWMTAGRGILHSETPTAEEGEGLQLWVNLKAKDKMVEPSYQELTSEELPRASHKGVKATVIAGSALGAKSPVKTRQPVSYLDFEMEAGSVLVQPIEAAHNSFSYVVSGSASFGAEGEEKEVQEGHTVVFAKGDALKAVRVRAGKSGCRLLLLSGEPTNEPVVQYGPFVMNTEKEIEDTFRDFQLGMNGFEKAPGWVSTAMKAMRRGR